MNSETSQNNLIIITRKNRCFRFMYTYSKTLILLLSPLILSPIVIVKNNNWGMECLSTTFLLTTLLCAKYSVKLIFDFIDLQSSDVSAYLSFFIFLVTSVYWATNVLHPGVTSLIPIVYITIMGIFDRKLLNIISINNSVLDCLGVMILINAIEQSNLHKRAAIKILLTFGCSHFRLSFLLFFSTMVLSMWFTNTMACALMMPLVKEILKELEKMGILETREITTSIENNDETSQQPTDFTIFYFLGIAYSSSIGGMTTVVGSEVNPLLRNYCSTIFPQSPRVEIPDFLLLTLPGIIVMEMCLYLWLNFYFLGMLRVQNYTALQASLTGDEEQYISLLLNTQYVRMGKLPFNDMFIGGVIILNASFKIIANVSVLTDDNFNADSLVTSVPTIMCSFVLFVLPVTFDCLKFCTRDIDLPSTGSRAFLTWPIIKNNILWSVLFVAASTNITFEAMKHTKMLEEFKKFLVLFSNLPHPVVGLAVIILCKVLTEFGSSSTVVNSMLQQIANLSVEAKINPLYLMITTTLSSCQPFHLITGTPTYALVAAYVNIPHRKMIIAGIGPSLAGILISLFTINVWSKAVWSDIDIYPTWAETFKNNSD